MTPRPPRLSPTQAALLVRLVEEDEIAIGSSGGIVGLNALMRRGLATVVSRFTMTYGYQHIVKPTPKGIRVAPIVRERIEA